MSNRLAQLGLAVFVCAASSVFASAAAADQPAAQEKAKDTAAASTKEDSRKAAATVSPEAVPSSGVVVFIDPATGKVRQPEAAEIGALLSTQPSAKTAAPVVFQGPGTAVGVKLDASSYVYMVATKSSDGKLAASCVTGDAAATALVATGSTSPTKEADNVK